MTYNKVERRKIEEMNQFRFYIYIWKCHKKILCVAILNKQKCHFFSFTKSGGQNRVLFVGRLIPVGVEKRWRKDMGG
jgi:hypothetical protein